MLDYRSVYTHSSIYQKILFDRPTILPSELGTSSQVYT